MKRLGIDVGGLVPGGDWRDTPFHPPTCPGARVLVTRDELAALVRGGETFEQDGTHVPAGGYGHARVRCGRTVPGRKGASGHVAYDGLCPSCSGLEADNRAQLRERQGAG